MNITYKSNEDFYFLNNTDIGQNFLYDKSIVTKMLAACDKLPCALEIGPGKGILTSEMLNFFERVFAIEIDRRLEPYLAPIFENPKGALFWGDVLKLDLKSTLPCVPDAIVSNLPYHITTPLIWKFLEELAPYGTKQIILMIQKETLTHFMTGCENNNSRNRLKCPLGITLQLMGNLKRLFDVPRGAFRPMPRVASSVIKIDINKNQNLANDAVWRKLIRGSFANRRKTLINNWNISLGIEAEVSKNILAMISMTEKARAEELNTNTWLQLLDVFKNLKN